MIDVGRITWDAAGRRVRAVHHRRQIMGDLAGALPAVGFSSTVPLTVLSFADNLTLGSVAAILAGGSSASPSPARWHPRTPCCVVGAGPACIVLSSPRDERTRAFLAHIMEAAGHVGTA